MKRILVGLSDIIFPPGCLTCDTILKQHEDLPFCGACYLKIHFIQSSICPRCGIPFAGADGGSHLCGDCIVSKSVYSAARAVGRSETTVLEAIHRFKYNGRIHIGEILEKLMAEFTYPAFNIGENSLIIPAPLHPKRLRERGFNQSVVLARELCKRFHVRLDFMTLKRHVYTEPQISLGKKERETNVHVFPVADAGKVKRQRIIIVDDVYT
ncbi:MAG: double zinc ribbon domain-containing protein [Syntrophales bacterium]